MNSDSSTSTKPKKPFKRELIEWSVILSIILILYTTGLHVPVIGRLQRVLLWTGLMKPDIEQTDSNSRKARYNMPLLTLDDEPTSLQAFEGKTIFLNFWATWCPPCIAEMPNIEKLYQSMSAEQDIVFVMVSLDEDHEKARRYIARNEYSMPVYFLNGTKPGVYSSTVVPTTYVISPEGNIVTERKGMAHYNTSAFKEFLRSL